MIDEDFECALHGYLQKAELEYRAEYKPEGSCVEWLADSCDSVEDIVKRLRGLGFRIRFSTLRRNSCRRVIVKKIASLR